MVVAVVAGHRASPKAPLAGCWASACRVELLQDRLYPWPLFYLNCLALSCHFNNSAHALLGQRTADGLLRLLGCGP